MILQPDPFPGQFLNNRHCGEVLGSSFEGSVNCMGDSNVVLGNMLRLDEEKHSTVFNENPVLSSHLQSRCPEEEIQRNARTPSSISIEQPPYLHGLESQFPQGLNRMIWSQQDSQLSAMIGSQASHLSRPAGMSHHHSAVQLATSNWNNLNPALMDIELAAKYNMFIQSPLGTLFQDPGSKLPGHLGGVYQHTPASSYSHHAQQSVPLISPLGSANTSIAADWLLAHHDSMHRCLQQSTAAASYNMTTLPILDEVSFAGTEGAEGERRSEPNTSMSTPRAQEDLHLYHSQVWSNQEQLGLAMQQQGPLQNKECFGSWHDQTLPMIFSGTKSLDQALKGLPGFGNPEIDASTVDQHILQVEAARTQSLVQSILDSGRLRSTASANVSRTSSCEDASGEAKEGGDDYAGIRASAEEPPRTTTGKCLASSCTKTATKSSMYCATHSGRRCQHVSGCAKFAVGRKMLCIAHGGGQQCQHYGCSKSTQANTFFCISHGGGRRCQHTEGCSKSAVGATGFCKGHGGGRRCQQEKCTKSARGSTMFCAGHGGGKRCQHPLGCTKSAVGSTPLCVVHGGGRRCCSQGCTKSAAGGTHFCISHGGGKPCRFEGCRKSAQAATPFCIAHGGGRRCRQVSCHKLAVSGTSLCKEHGDGPRCQHEWCMKMAIPGTFFCGIHKNKCLQNSLLMPNSDMDSSEHMHVQPIPQYQSQL
mmetsp:Transcript_30549/g.58837  ORF Transcript_30549/g.58837 Transcript_30549/m.58837 type:complete len:703 (+) Transcript_30549:315-2423(+)